MFQFCWEMFCVHQGRPGAEWKFSECSRRKVSIFCRPAILCLGGHQGRRRPKVLVWASRGLLLPITNLLSPAWPGAPHILKVNLVSSYPHITIYWCLDNSPRLSVTSLVPIANLSSELRPVMSINCLLTCHGSVLLHSFAFESRHLRTVVAEQEKTDQKVG